jgi:hypothetical protein
MDNRRDLPGYKYFVDAETGKRPAVYVAFLDLTHDPATEVNGVLFPVDADGLTRLDARERNYERRDVTVAVDPAPPGPVWAYFGTTEARDRFDQGNAVVSREYLERVRAGFEALGELRRFEASTDLPPVPVRELLRVDLP